MLPLEPGRRALVVGLGRSGAAAAALLDHLGLHTVGYDRGTPSEPLPAAMVAMLGAPSVPPAAFAGVDLVVLSPGVPPAPVRAAAAELAPQAVITGELALALAALQQRRIAGASPVPAALITGTNGKSTVTALTGALLAAAGMRPFVGGNLGVPPTQALLDVARGAASWGDALVLECSSYQLETFTGYPSRAVAIVNLTPDHLERHGSMDGYARAKARIARGLDPGGCVLIDAGNPYEAPLLRDVRGHRVLRVHGNGGPRLVGGALQLPDGREWPRAELRLPGSHNTTNALFAVAIAAELGADTAAIQRGLRGFEGLPHRMALVREHAGVAWFDDSKATNVAAQVAGLEGFERRFVLIAGGQAKAGDDPRLLRPILAARARAVVGLGAAGPTYVALAQDLVPAELASSMADAVERAGRLAQPGDAVVLCPGGASFDLFANYAARGEAFARCVAALA